METALEANLCTWAEGKSSKKKKNSGDCQAPQLSTGPLVPGAPGDCPDPQLPRPPPAPQPPHRPPMPGAGVSSDSWVPFACGHPWLPVAQRMKQVACRGTQSEPRFSPPPPPSSQHTQAHAHTHAPTHTCTHTRYQSSAFAHTVPSPSTAPPAKACAPFKVQLQCHLLQEAPFFSFKQSQGHKLSGHQGQAGDLQLTVHARVEETDSRAERGL